MSRKQTLIVLFEILLLILGIFLYFAGDSLFSGKFSEEEEILRKEILGLSEKIDVYEDSDSRELFTKNFLEIRKSYNQLSITFVEKDYTNALSAYTEFVQELESLKSEVDSHYADLKAKREQAAVEDELAQLKKDQEMKIAQAVSKAKKEQAVAVAAAKKEAKTTETTPSGSYTYAPLKKVSSEPAAAEPVKAAATQAVSADNSGKVDINNASIAELDKLPRIGPVKANAIYDYRMANGGFTSIEDIVSVSGIGEKTYALLKPLIYCGKFGTASSPAVSTSSPASSQTSAADKVNINTANQTQLETLPRIGPATARNIINYRDENGPFKTYEDIMNVPRIGEKTLANIKPFIKLGDGE